MKYTKKQIQEALAYWRGQLKKKNHRMANESAMFKLTPDTAVLGEGATAEELTRMMVDSLTTTEPDLAKRIALYNTYSNVIMHVGTMSKLKLNNIYKYSITRDKVIFSLYLSTRHPSENIFMKAGLVLNILKDYPKKRVYIMNTFDNPRIDDNQFGDHTIRDPRLYPVLKAEFNAKSGFWFRSK